MSKIKVVSWDVYGTIIESGHSETSDVEELEHLRARPGALEALSQIESRGIIQCTCSDGDITNLKNNLKSVGIDWTDYFNSLYEMPLGNQKDFLSMIEKYKIKPENLLVIGDNYDLDLDLAKKQGCHTLWVPELNKDESNPLDVHKIREFLELE